MRVRPIRLCVFGDSFVAGVGDPAQRGWVGRLTERVLTDPITEPTVDSSTVYNLGVRRDTAADVRARWSNEVHARLSDGYDNRVLFSFGVNDTTGLGASVRVSSDESVGHLAAILADAAARGLPALVIGPPPIADAEQNARTARLDRMFASLCATRGVPYLPVFTRLSGATVWMQEVENGDGAHPAAGGYRQLADLVVGPCLDWLRAEPASRR